MMLAERAVVHAPGPPAHGGGPMGSVTARGEGDRLRGDQRGADVQLDLRMAGQRDVAWVAPVDLAVVQGDHAPYGGTCPAACLFLLPLDTRHLSSRPRRHGHTRGSRRRCRRGTRGSRPGETRAWAPSRPAVRTVRRPTASPARPARTLAVATGFATLARNAAR